MEHPTFKNYLQGFVKRVTYTKIMMKTHQYDDETTLSYQLGWS